MSKIDEFIDIDLIKVITGIRRSGKSYFLNLLIEKLILEKKVDRENILLIDLEIPPYNYITTREELDEIVLEFIKRNNSKVYLFFDEIQKVKEWEKSIAGYHKLKNTDIYITGSNSKLLSKELATLLTGRYVNIPIYPFSFNEFLDYKIELNDECIINNKNNSEIENLFEEYLEYGGMPVTIATRKNKLTTLNDLFSSILYNDIIERFNVRNTGLFKRIIRFIIENIGNLISANSIYKHLKPTIPEGLTTKTIYNYLDYLEEGFLLSKVSNESLIGYDEIVGLEKYYLMDHGFYKSELEEKQINIGRRLENIVFLHLLRNDYIVTVGRINSLEVDFIAKKDNKRIYIQVSYLLYDEKVIKREFEPLLKIRDNYPKYVLSMDKLDFSREGIEHVNIISFLRNFN
ncbi:ATP-binding protein [Methanosphaera sp. ISO3-F5]|uniref:ATP-binding protein n=1 Tax=Methanosphaera sp. ISO3-F5 TaxID=1452353 RepID=UPI002B256CAB|nr:ATP-binding protein [Methanosphaera sp. ISO3-F5]WQH64922.1 ATP-binding protein [Methanosphaera sp. ISO3-F5]